MRQWNGWSVCLWIVALLLAAGADAQTPNLEDRVRRLEDAQKAEPNTFRAFWEDGLRLQTRDQEIVLEIGGKLQNDWNFSFFSDDIEDAFGDPDNRIFIRRASLETAGTLYKLVDFKLAIDFAGGDVEFEDAYLRLRRLPYVGRFTVGKFKTPFGLEFLTSSRFITLQERSLMSDAFTIGRELGVMLRNTALDQRLTWALALTYPTDNDASETDDINLTLRLTGAPWYAEQGRRLVHLGFAFGYRHPPDNEVRLRATPEARVEVDDNTVRFVDTGILDANRAYRTGFEGALVYGPFSFQGEGVIAWTGSDVDDPTVKDAVDGATFSAFYVMLSYFLSGEHRPYNLSSATFGRPQPRKNALRGGWGAWEIALRFSYINLNDAEALNPTRGGKENNLTFGVN